MLKKIIPILIVLAIISLFHSCEKEVYSTQPDEATIKNSKIIVKTNPPGAAIYLNGKNMGLKTPDSLTWLKPDTYQVTFKLGLFSDKTKQFVINDSSRLEYYYDYYTDPLNLGSISVTSIPSSANIFLNDVLINQKTPATLTGLTPGSYKVKVQYPQFRSDSTTFDIRGNIIKSISFKLEDTTKWISYNIKNSAIGSNSLSALSIDQSNNIWIGSTEGILTQFNPSRVLRSYESKRIDGFQ